MSEAINSMFRWYENSQVCYAYLSDVRTFPAGQDSVGLLVFQDGVFLPEFRASKWFTRGWTLQELLATYCEYNFTELLLRLWGISLEAFHTYLIADIDSDLT